jgi:hypothetical protein
LGLNFNNQSNNNICFIHCCNLIDRTENPFLNNLLINILNYKFHNNLDYIIINNIGYKINLDVYLSKYPELVDKIKIINYSNKTDLFEIPTIKLIWYFSNIYSNTNILYLHTKGISYEFYKNYNQELIYCINDWVNFMLFNLISSDLPIKLLNEFDSIGCNYSDMDCYGDVKPHWSGNFWLGKSNYIKSLDISNLNSKHDSKWFILSSNKCNYFELTKSNINHYEKRFPENNYKKTNIYLKNNNYNFFLNYIKKAYKYPSAWKGHFEFALWLVNILNPKVVVELGVDYAHSTFCLSSELDKNSVIYGIDCFEGDIQAGLINTFDVINNTHKFLLDTKLLPNNNVKFIKGYFNDVCMNFTEKIDLLHIDGLHDYESVKNDFDSWFPKLSDNGVVIFHDTISFPNDVGKFFNELQYYKTNFIHSAGLGVLAKNKNIIDFIQKNWTDILDYKAVYNDETYLTKFLENVDEYKFNNE